MNKEVQAATSEDHGQVLSFDALEKRIRGMSESPDLESVEAPRWMRIACVIGGAGLAGAYLSTLLVKRLGPDPALVSMGAAGVLLMACFLPWMVWSLWAMLRDLRHWIERQAARMDHDRAQWLQVSQWLRGFPREELERHLRFARAMQARISQKMGLMAGGVDRLGILPMAVAAYALLMDRQRLLSLPGWLLVIGFLIPFLWLICWRVVDARNRIQLYEILTEEALRLPPGPARPAQRPT